MHDFTEELSFSGSPFVVEEIAKPSSMGFTPLHKNFTCWLKCWLKWAWLSGCKLMEYDHLISTFALPSTSST